MLNKNHSELVIERCNMIVAQHCFQILMRLKRSSNVTSNFDIKAAAKSFNTPVEVLRQLLKAEFNLEIIVEAITETSTELHPMLCEELRGKFFNSIIEISEGQET